MDVDCFSNSTETPLKTNPDLPVSKQAIELLAHLAPINLTICLLAILLNSFIIHYYYYPNRSGVLSYMFSSIAAADIFTALGHVSLLVTALSTHGLSDDPIIGAAKIALSIGCMLYLILGIFGNNCSIFYNLVLSTLRTYVIVVQIPSIRSLAIVIAAVIHFIFWFSMLCIDVWFYAAVILPHYPPYFLFPVLTSGAPYIGYGFCNLFPDKAPYFHSLCRVSSGVFLAMSHLLPSIIVLVSMFVQSVALLWGRTEDPERRHVTTTIVLLSLLFCACHGSNALLTGLTFYTPVINMTLLTVASTVLPLLNAAVSPIILICRSENLSRDFVAIFRKLAGLVKKKMCCYREQDGAGEERENLLEED